MAQTQQAISHWSIGRGRGRGARQNQPYVPSRRPGQASSAPKEQPKDNVAQAEATLSKCSLDSQGQSENDSKEITSFPSSEKVTGSPARSSSSKASVPNVAGLKTGVTKLKAKYSYKANPNSPLGEAELTMKQGDSVVFVEPCKDNESWWKVQKDNQTGFVPATYLEKVGSEKITQLPWLEAKKTEESELPQCKPEWMPYKSAYNREVSTTSASSSAKDSKDQFFCKLCNKQLNGPQPYSAHMMSKAHKLEVELAKEYGTYTED